MGIWVGIFLLSAGVLIFIFGERLDEWHGGGDEMTILICVIAAIIITSIVGLIKIVMLS